MAVIGHVIVRASREGVDPGAPTRVPAPGRGNQGD